MTNEPSTGADEQPPDPDEQLQQAQQSAIDALTSAARVRRPDGRPVDVAEVVMIVLASVAANVGGVDQLLAGRPGSWEAYKLGDLLYSTVGEDDRVLFRYRTESVVLHLDVARVVEHLYPYSQAEDWTTPYEREIAGAVAEFERAQERLDQDAETNGENLYVDIDEAEYVALEREYEAARRAVDDRWRARYTRYAEEFSAAVHAEAARLGLPVPVTVHTHADLEPDPAFREPPSPYTPNADALLQRLWDAGLDAAPLPGTERRTEARAEADGAGEAEK